ncbi:MAG: hypothetical protein ABSH53_13195 [Holophaga sp.]|jgi:hypothetical protein
MLSRPAAILSTLALLLGWTPCLEGRQAPPPAQAAPPAEAPAKTPRKAPTRKESLDNFSKGMFYHTEFTRYMGNEQHLPMDEVRRLARENLVKSMACLSRVNPDHLAAIHPGLPEVFRNQMLVLVGMEKEIFLETQTTRARPDAQELFRKYGALLGTYVEWMKAHAAEFKQPVE